MSLVFVAGPLSGLIMQPLIGERKVLACADIHKRRLIVLERVAGIFADRSQSRFGRRRPFMIIGCVVSMFAMMLLGWAREISAFFGGVSLGG
jgi:solute carrier family 45 protein 1/2/4